MTIICFLSVACSTNNTDNDKPYSIKINGNNAYVELQRPTSSVVELGKTDWHGVSLSEVVNDLYDSLIKSGIQEDCHLYVRFIDNTPDKYGNEHKSFDEHFLLTLPITEVKRYKDGHYFDANYRISNKIIYAVTIETDTITPEQAPNPYANMSAEQADSLEREWQKALESFQIEE